MKQRAHQRAKQARGGAPAGHPRPEKRQEGLCGLWKCSDRTHGSYTHIMYTHPGACALKRIYIPGFMRGWIFIALGAPGVLTSNPPPRTSRKLPRTEKRRGRVPDFWVCRPRVCPVSWGSRFFSMINDLTRARALLGPRAARPRRYVYIAQHPPPQGICSKPSGVASGCCRVT